MKRDTNKSESPKNMLWQSSLSEQQQQAVLTAYKESEDDANLVPYLL